MSRASVMAWLFPTVLCCVLSAVYLSEWRASRELREKAHAEHVSALREIRAESAFEASKTRALLKELQATIDAVLRRETQPAVSNAREASAPAPAGEAPSAAEDPSRAVAEEPPELPSGVDALELVRSAPLSGPRRSPRVSGERPGEGRPMLP